MGLFLTVKENMISGGSLADKCRRAADAGFAGFDFMGASLQAQLPEAKRALEETGLKPSAVYGQLGQPGTSLIGRTAAERSRTLDAVKGRLEAAAEVGADTLIFVPRFGLPDIREEAAEWMLVAMLDELADWAEGVPVTLVMEPLNRGESRFLHDPLKALRICRTVNRPNVRTMVDTYHMAVEGQDMAALIRETEPCLALVHLSDSERKLPGEGKIDFRSVLKALKAIGYGGALGFECGEADVPALRDSVARLNGIWKELGN